MQRAPQPSCFDRVKIGFMIGFAVGMSSAGLFGTYSALRYGLRGRELMSSVGKLMLQGGGTFGVFMSVGTGHQMLKRSNLARRSSHQSSAVLLGVRHWISDID